MINKKLLLKKIRRFFEIDPTKKFARKLPIRSGAIYKDEYFIEFSHHNKIIHKLTVDGLLNATELYIFLEKLGPTAYSIERGYPYYWSLICKGADNKIVFQRYTHIKPLNIRLAFFLIKKRYISHWWHL